MRTRRSRQSAGRRAHALGSLFEAELERTHALYQKANVAWIFHVPTGTAPLPMSLTKAIETACLRAGVHPRQLRRVTHKPGEYCPYDYAGVVGSGLPSDGPMPPGVSGLAIAMEAKSDTGSDDKPKTSLAIVPVNGKRSGLQAHQLESLVAVHDAGGIAAVVWRSGPPLHQRRLVIQGHRLASAWREYQSGGRRSIPARAGVEYHRVRMGAVDWCEHWLPAALAGRSRGEDAA